MPARRLPGSPRASRAMIDLLYSVGACSDVGSWDVSGQADGVVVRLRTRQVFDTEPLALDAAETMIKRIVPSGYDAVTTAAAARREGASGEQWRGLAEVVVMAAR